MNETYNPPPATPPPGAQASAAVPPAPAAQTGMAPYPVIIERKSPKAAGWLSLLFPGIGLLYLGLYQRAFTLAGATVFCIVMNAHGGGTIFGPITFFIWIFGIIDAVQQAKALNRSQIPVSVNSFSPQGEKSSNGTGWLTLGVVMTGIGALWLADRYDYLDLINELPGWVGPLAFILLGLTLIIGHVRRSRREK